VLRVIDGTATRDLSLPKSFTEGVRDFDTSEHVMYTEEAPNALAPEMLPVFWAALRESFPRRRHELCLGVPAEHLEHFLRKRSTTASKGPGQCAG